jgi:hypothetical protein
MIEIADRLSKAHFNFLSYFSFNAKISNFNKRININNWLDDIRINHARGKCQKACSNQEKQLNFQDLFIKLKIL